MTTGKQCVGPETHAANRPQGIGLFHAIANASIDEPVIELFEIQSEMFRRIWTEFISQADTPVHMHPLEMHGIDGVLLGLKPVAGNLGEDDLAESVLPLKRLPVRYKGNGFRP